jgi:hypothetical protein
VAFTENMAAFFNVAEFAVSATLNGATTVTGIFDDASIDVLSAAATAPRFTCPASSINRSHVGQTLVVNSTNYIVRAVEPDGTGINSAQLERQ